MNDKKETEAKLDYTEIEKLSSEILEKSKKQKDELSKLYEKMESGNSEDASVIDETSKSLWRASKNIRKAYANCLSAADEFTARWDDIKSSRKKRKVIPAAPANSLIDKKEKELMHFTEGMSIYKLMWVCYIGSFFGVLVEMLWCLLMEGQIKSRAGLVYGPFNLLYGAGAVVVTALLYKYRNNGKLVSFIGGLIGGSFVEYFFSYLQELIFGTVSWDYSEMPFNINGRICLAYSFMWGLLGVIWIKSIYPRISSVMMKVPSKAGKVISWVLFAFFLINALVSALAVYRWSQRVSGIEAASALWQFIDSRFTDERMSRIFYNMKF